MSLIDEIKRDRARSTTGHYFYSGEDYVQIRRVARVSEMEAALLAAEELAQAAINLFGIAQDEGIVGDRTTLPAMAAALAAYRKAVGA